MVRFLIKSEVCKFFLIDGFF